MSCVLRGTWLGNDISQHAGFHFTCQDLLRISKALSGSARSVSYWSPFARVQLLTLSRFHLLPTCAFPHRGPDSENIACWRARVSRRCGLFLTDALMNRSATS